MSSSYQSLTVLARVSSLGVVTEFIRSGARKANLPKSRMGELDVVIEEVFINVCRYSYPDGSTGDFTMTYSVPLPGRLRVQIDDEGIEFNPLAVLQPELDSPRRCIGGLGILLVKSFAESLVYSREKGRNRLTFEISAEG